jgi:hypothetical protein
VGIDVGANWDNRYACVPTIYLSSRVFVRLFLDLDFSCIVATQLNPYSRSIWTNASP